MRLDERIDAAIERASKRYFDALFFIAPNGAKSAIYAIKSQSVEDALQGTFSSTRARRFEFVISRKTFDCLNRDLVGTSSDSSETTLDRWRSSKLMSRRGNVETLFQIDPTRPYLENSPNGGSVRLNAYELKVSR